MCSFIQACSSALCLYVLENWNKRLIVEQLEHYTAGSKLGSILGMSHEQWQLKIAKAKKHSFIYLAIHRFPLYIVHCQLKVWTHSHLIKKGLNTFAEHFR